jgi:hypothetical protein
VSVESAHARYRARLVALAGAAAVSDALDHATDRWGVDTVRWTRRSERFEPDEEPFATCLYEGSGDRQRLARVEVFTERPRPPEGSVLTRAEPGWLVVSTVSADPALPALQALLAGPGRPTVIRYHPGRRCTIRIEQDGRVRFAKLYAQGRAARAYADATALWRSARRGELRFAVARRDHLDEARGAVWQDALAGRPIAARLFAAGDEVLARRIGRAAGSLSRSRVRPLRLRDAAGELARPVRRAAELERRVPSLAGPLRRLVHALELRSAGGVAARLEPVHGALHPAQWREDGSRLGLLDYATRSPWEHPSSTPRRSPPRRIRRIAGASPSTRSTQPSSTASRRRRESSIGASSPCTARTSDCGRRSASRARSARTATRKPLVGCVLRSQR